MILVYSWIGWTIAVSGNNACLFSPLLPVFFFKSLVLRTIHTHHDPYWVFYVSKQGCVVFICRICKFLFACKGNLYILGHPEGGGSH